jgi:FkbM family methyltransferase
MYIEPYTPEYALGEFKLHGEYQLQERLKHVPLGTIFDVGANCGEWTRMARSFQPSADIHTFELIPQTFKKMIDNNVIDENVYPNSFGLSNHTGIIPVNMIPANDRVTTTVLTYGHTDAKRVNALVTTGEYYCMVQEIRFVDFLKLDCEGHEYEVLEGFRGVLDAKAVGCIQFEYGLLNILTKKLLMDFHLMLTPLEFAIGKLTPEGVYFKDFNLLDEDFRGPDYVAVHRSRQDIINAVQIL